MATAKRPQVAFPAANSDYRAARLRSAVACRAYNDLPEDAPSEQRVALWHNIIGSPSSSSPSTPPAPPPTPAAPYIKPPLHTDYGTNLHIAPTTFINRNLTVLDTPELPVRIGERCLLGPNVSIYAVAHPVGWRERNGPLGAPSYASEVVIEDDCWIGGGVTVVGGVRIGRGAVVGAGSVVTKDVPAEHVALGVPARVVGSVSEDSRVRNRGSRKGLSGVAAAVGRGEIGVLRGAMLTVLLLLVLAFTVLAHVFVVRVDVKVVLG